MSWKEQLTKEENWYKASAGAIFFYTTLFVDRAIRQGESLHIANKAGLEQGAFTFISALTLLTLYDKYKVKIPPLFLNITLSTISGIGNAYLQMDSGGSLIESSIMGSSTFGLIYLHEKEIDKIAFDIVKEKPQDRNLILQLSTDNIIGKINDKLTKTIQNKSWEKLNYQKKLK